MFAKLKALNALETLGVAFFWTYGGQIALIVLVTAMEPPAILEYAGIAIWLIGTLGLIGYSIVKVLRRADRAQMRGDWERA